MNTNTEADVRTDTGIKVMALFFVAIISVSYTHLTLPTICSV